MKALIANRVVLVILTSLATGIGTSLATAYPAVYTAMCGG